MITFCTAFVHLSDQFSLKLIGFLLSVMCPFHFLWIWHIIKTFLQTIVQPSSESYDVVRTLRMAGYGMLILGPSLHFWFNFMSKVLPKRDIMTTLKKIVMGQIVFGPAMTVIFFSVNAALQGKTNGIIFTRHVNKDSIIFRLKNCSHFVLCLILPCTCESNPELRGIFSKKMERPQ